MKVEQADDLGALGQPGRDRVVDAPVDSAEAGVRRVPGPEHGVAAGDPAGEVPVAPNLEGLDYWEVHPARGAGSRVHVEWRRSLYNPAGLPEGVTLDGLQKERITQKEFADGTADVEQDEWGETRVIRTWASPGRRRELGGGRRGSFSRMLTPFRDRRGG